MQSRLIQALLLAAVAVALVWLIVGRSLESLLAAITAVVAVLSLWRTGSRRRDEDPRTEIGNRVAVLPLQNITEEEGREYFADGLTEELISVLSRVGGLRIIAKSSVMRYQAHDRPISQIGQELNVGSVLEGSVRCVGSNLKVSVRLIDTGLESHLWSADYERELQDVFSVQSDIATQVARALEVSIMGGEAKRIGRPPTTDLEAYDLYLLARHDLSKRTAEGLLRCIERLHQAVEKDPGFGAAYAGLADAYVLATIGYAIIPFPEAAREARRASSRALEIQETLSDAHTSRGWVLLNLDWDFQGAESEFQRAVEINPSNARAYQWLAQCFMYQDRWEEGIPASRKAQELDPRSAVIAVEAGWPFYYAGRNEEALEYFHRAIDLEPELPLGHFNVGNVLESEGRVEEALEKFEHAADLSGKSPMYVAFQARALALLGRREEAMKALEGVLEAATGGAASSVYVAHVYDALGEPEAALTWLERAADRRDPMILAINTRWLPFLTLREEPRYQEVLAGLPVDKKP